MKISRYFLSTALLMTLLQLYGCTTYNQATDRNEFIFISTSQEVGIGRDVHKQLQRQFKFSDDYTKTVRLHRIGRKVAQVSDRQDYTYNFYLIEQDQLNAFTTPGGNVYIFTGLMDKLKTDDELAAVLAHEIGHCAAKHVTKKYQAAMGYNLVGSVVLGQIDSGNKSRETIMRSTNTLMQLVFSAYGRQDEYESDMLGLKYMRLSGFDLDGMIKTLTLLKTESKGPRVPLMLRSHPHLEDRIVRVKEEIDRITYLNN